MIRKLYSFLSAPLAHGIALAGLVLAAPAGAECLGANLLDQMAEAERDALLTAAEAVPYPRGNFWQAEKDGVTLTLIGTYHLDDPRHQAALDRFGPLVAKASRLLVEAGPDEEKALVDKMARDPSVLTITDGPSLLEQLPPEVWQDLVIAASARGMPGFMLAKFRPWYVTVLLSIPPCALDLAAQPKGLDGQLVDIALAADVPVQALEPYDTVFRVFDTMTPQEQVDMVVQALSMEDRITDFSVTLADSYFAGDNRLMWELMRKESYAMPGYTRAQVDAEMARMEEVLMAGRNRGWIPVIEAAAAEAPADAPLVAAFGALHLSGDEGVLNLLAGRGWTITQIALP
ncbi:MAG: TraB/GumN family protein [Paracoccaceae bacterium]